MHASQEVCGGLPETLHSKQYVCIDAIQYSYAVDLTSVRQAKRGFRWRVHARPLPGSGSHRRNPDIRVPAQYRNDPLRTAIHKS